MAFFLPPPPRSRDRGGEFPRFPPGSAGHITLGAVQSALREPAPRATRSTPVRPLLHLSADLALPTCVPRPRFTARGRGFRPPPPGPSATHDWHRAPPGMAPKSHGDCASRRRAQRAIHRHCAPCSRVWRMKQQLAPPSPGPGARSDSNTTANSGGAARCHPGRRSKIQTEWGPPPSG